jgi:DNA-binding transcriptional LysR family regulator
VTPTQLRAFAAVVRLGSVKAAARDLSVSEAAVSMHVAHLRKQLGDKLFARTGAGLAFTPGGLRLASRASELLGLQDRTILEVSQAGFGRRLLRVGASSLFAEYAAPGLIDLFANRADDLDVELSVHSSHQFPGLLVNRTIDVALGPRPAPADGKIACVPFLNYAMALVVGPQHALAGRPLGTQASVSELRQQTWLLGPSAVDRADLATTVLRQINVPEEQQRIFQSHTAAVEEAKHSKGVALVLASAVTQDVAAGDLRQLSVPAFNARSAWHAATLSGRTAPAAAEELVRFVTTPRATQAMLRGGGVNAGRFRPAIHVTLWS